MKAIFGALIALIVMLALLPVVQSFVSGANVTGSSATLVSLIPLFWVLAAVGIAVALGIQAYKGQK